MKKVIAVMFALMLALPCVCAAEDQDVNALTLIDQPDRQIEIQSSRAPAVKKGTSTITGLKNSESYQPILVEYNNENGGIYATAPKGITKASVIYEYQVSTNGTMGLCALFQDELPRKVGPVGNASVGGLLVEDDWKCAYIYHDIPKGADGGYTELGYSMQTWIERYDLMKKRMIYPANVSKTKEWKQYFKLDNEMITEESENVDVSGIKGLIVRNEVSPSPAGYAFLDNPDSFEGEVYVKEINIRTPSRVFSSAFIYNEDDHKYYRWVGEGNQYGDVEADEQLSVSNLIIQRVEYNTSNKMMAPVTIGRGNADIFIRGFYIDGYWVRNSADEHTRFYDSDGNLLKLDPGTTFISLLTNSTSVVILDY